MNANTTSVRVARETHRELKQLAAELEQSVGETVAIAVRRLRQEQRGRELSEPLASSERAWLDADLG